MRNVSLYVKEIEVGGLQCCLVTNILQNIFFCVPKKKASYRCWNIWEVSIMRFTVYTPQKYVSTKVNYSINYSCAICKSCIDNLLIVCNFFFFLVSAQVSIDIHIKPCLTRGEGGGVEDGAGKENWLFISKGPWGDDLCEGDLTYFDLVADHKGCIYITWNIVQLFQIVTIVTV